jgi:hypothetical protein
VSPPRRRYGPRATASATANTTAATTRGVGVTTCHWPCPGHGGEGGHPRRWDHVVRFGPLIARRATSHPPDADVAAAAIDPVEVEAGAGSPDVGVVAGAGRLRRCGVVRSDDADGQADPMSRWTEVTSQMSPPGRHRWPRTSASSPIVSSTTKTWFAETRVPCACRQPWALATHSSALVTGSPCQGWWPWSKAACRAAASGPMHAGGRISCLFASTAVTPQIPPGPCRAGCSSRTPATRRERASDHL